MKYIFKEDENLVSECTLMNLPVIFTAAVTLQRPLLVIDCHFGQVTNEGAETDRENLSQGDLTESELGSETVNSASIGLR